VPGHFVSCHRAEELTLDGIGEIDTARAPQLRGVPPVTPVPLPPAPEPAEPVPAGPGTSGPVPVAPAAADPGTRS
jgi:hypothetical protein